MCARILVIDDNRTNLDLMLYLLQSRGHTPVGADSGLTGLLTALEGDYDLCLCDILMPGIDGFELAKRIKADARCKSKPLVAVTALAMVGDRDRVLAAGFDGYMDKPIDPHKFVDQVETFLPETMRLHTTRVKNGPPPKVLVVDDLAVNRKLMVTILKYGGYGVLEAANGAEALAIVHKERPDLMIFDVNMPIMGGRELVERFKADGGLDRTKLALYTASLADDEMQNFVRWSGVRCVIEKPSEPNHVLSMVRSALQQEVSA